jgi:hypothetical protein
MDPDRKGRCIMAEFDWEAAASAINAAPSSTQKVAPEGARLASELYPSGDLGAKGIGKRLADAGIEAVARTFGRVTDKDGNVIEEGTMYVVPFDCLNPKERARVIDERASHRS